MKAKLLFISFIICLTANAQWHPTNGPDGGNIQVIAINGNNLFAGTDKDGVIMSTDSGATWTFANNGLSSKNIIALVAIGNSVFAGTDSDGVFVSVNNGGSWSAVNNGLTSPYISCLAVKGTDLFAGTKNGLFLSTNSGSNWNLISPVIIQSLTIKGVDMFAGSKGIIHSIDNGITWTNSKVGLDSILAGWPPNQYYIVATPKIFAVYGNTILAATATMGLYLSVNNGASWTRISSSLSNSSVSTVTTMGSLIFTGGSSGLGEGKIFSSADSGKTWTPKNNGLFALGISCFAVNGTHLIAGTDMGIFLSKDSGTSWLRAKTSLRRVNITKLATKGNTLFAGTYCGVFQSTNNGINWTNTSNGLPEAPIRALTINGNMLFAGTNGNTGKNIYVSSDTGNNWVAAGAAYGGEVDALALSVNNLFAGTFYGVSLSTDSGQNWTSVNNGLPFANMDIQSFSINGNNVYAGSQHGVYLTTDNGTNWTPVNNGLNVHDEVRDIAIMGNNLFAAILDDGVYKSSNSGSSWNASSAGMTNLKTLALKVKGTDIFAGTFGGGVFVSRDSGAYWFAVNAGLTNLNVSSLEVIGNYLFAGTYGNGVFAAPIDSILLQVSVKDLPANTINVSIYPNPTTGTIAIQCSEKIKEINISNLLGENTYTDVSRNNILSVNMTNKPSGIYFLQIKTDKGAEVKKIIKE